MSSEKTCEFGAVMDHTTHQYVRWVRKDDSPIPYLCVADCFRYIGVKRVDVPNGPRICCRVAGARPCSFWREDYERSGTTVVLGAPANNIRDLNITMSEGLSLSVAGGVERLCHFLLTNAPALFLGTCFVPARHEIVWK